MNLLALSHVEPSRVIRMTNVDEQGKFTKNSSYFVPYQCQYEALENNISIVYMLPEI